MDMTDDHDDDSFCKGAMDMNMDGFSSMFDDDPMCINFLFRTWARLFWESRSITLMKFAFLPVIFADFAGQGRIEI